MGRKFAQLAPLGILLAALISAGATSIKELSKPAILPKHCASPTCVKASDCGICFCNLDLGGICMIEPLAKNKTQK
jgi:hypothetical protein